MTENRPYEILLIEDNPADVRLFREALKRSAMAVHLDVATNGAEALAFLRRQTPFGHTRRPDLVFLDLNLPGVPGFEVLAQVKADPGLRRIPVLVLSTSRDKKDIGRAYDLHANCYLAKPRNLDDLYRLAGAIREFWLEWVSLPREALE